MTFDFWNLKNHGGQPTKNPDQKYAVFFGRFQPFHYGHEFLIRQKLEKGISCMIFVRDINPDNNNPLNTFETTEIIKTVFPENNVIVLPCQDIESVNFGRGVGYEVNEYFPPDNVHNISATEIRRQIKNGQNQWKNMVNPLAHALIEKYLHEK